MKKNIFLIIILNLFSFNSDFSFEIYYPTAKDIRGTAVEKEDNTLIFNEIKNELQRILTLSEKAVIKQSAWGPNGIFYKYRLNPALKTSRDLILAKTVNLASLLSYKVNCQEIIPLLNSILNKEKLEKIDPSWIQDRIIWVEIINNMLYGTNEAYIKSLLRFSSNYSNNDFILNTVYQLDWMPEIEILYAESSSPECLNVLENGYYQWGTTEDFTSLWDLINKNNSKHNEQTFAQGLDYPNDFVRMWAAKKICDKRIKSLYPNVKELYESTRGKYSKMRMRHIMASWENFPFNTTGGYGTISEKKPLKDGF